MRKRRRPAQTVRTLVLILFLLAALLPMAWMLISSFKTEDEIYLDHPTWFPRLPTLANYGALFSQFGFARLTLNSVGITLGVVAISVLFGTMAAYGFSRYRFRGSAVLMGGLLLTRMITPASWFCPCTRSCRWWGFSTHGPASSLESRS